ncbi:O-antigen ligase family protein [Methylobacterium sp. Leaf85]|uniref:O-antigen ligase family protein n=1 Tax=Methylobacterium sp. Leaf85 TaxID=1736241 RepID=UPI0006F3B6B9|nr:O-antigen ligase family protein [Methylobacterium sp. Leaf85]KQO41564.1 hypothetical protein ASF08_14485 [Methylobacterium sp. Leaf85]
MTTIPDTSARGLMVRNVLCVAGYLLLLVSAYFIAKNLSAKLMIAGLVTIAVSDPTLLRERLPRPLEWGLAALAGFAAWTVLGLLVNGIPLGPASDAVANFALLAVALLAGRRLLACCGLRFILGALFAVASLSALLTLVLHFGAGLSLADRLVPLGRPSNSIPGAGGLCIALIGIVALLGDRSRPAAPATIALVALAALPVLVAVAMTQSRGPILATVVALAATRLPWRPGGWRLTGWRLFAVALLAWSLTTALIVIEPWLRAMLCVDQSNFCRPSSRQQIWTWVFEHISQRPLLGFTPVFRFADSLFNHAHNGLFGTAMYFGVPALVAALAMTFVYCRRLATVDGGLSTFCAAALIFSFGYMGSDLPNPFSFVNMHFFFLWLPIAFALAGRSEEAATGSD